MTILNKTNISYLTCKLGYWSKQFLAYLMCFLISFQPLMLQAAEITAAKNATNANQPNVGTAGNGVPLVNIVTPNASGLSHNKYDQFNVGQPGAILNNSNQNLQRSQLGGLVQGNSNLRNSGPASVICGRKNFRVTRYPGFSKRTSWVTFRGSSVVTGVTPTYSPFTKAFASLGTESMVTV